MPKYKKFIIYASSIILAVLILTSPAWAASGTTTDGYWYTDIVIPDEPQPVMSMSMSSDNVRWANYAAYLGRVLSVDFHFKNNSEVEVGPLVQGFLCTNGVTALGTFPVTTIPEYTPVGGTYNYTGQFLIPQGVSTFRVNVYLAATYSNFVVFFPSPVP